MKIGSLFSGIGGLVCYAMTMPSGAKPKVYPTRTVARVQELYALQHTQLEIAKVLGVSQKVVWNIMRRHGISARVAAKRDQRGALNHSWAGPNAKYAAMHLRVQAVRGTPNHCEDCGETSDEKSYEWASISKNYGDIMDYRRLCISCHHRMDGTVKNFQKRGGCP